VTIPVRSRLPSTSIQYRSFYFALAHITDTFLSSIACDFDQSTHDRRNCPLGQLWRAIPATVVFLVLCHLAIDFALSI
jgi:hypothetical protein